METNKTFPDWLASLTVSQYEEIIQEIMTECMISRTTLWVWKRGTATPVPIFRRIINRIATEHHVPQPFNTEAL